MLSQDNTVFSQNMGINFRWNFWQILTGLRLCRYYTLLEAQRLYKSDTNGF